MYKELPESGFLLCFLSFYNDKNRTIINKRELEKKLYYYVMDDKFIDICDSIAYKDIEEEVDLGISFKKLNQLGVLKKINEEIYQIDLCYETKRRTYNTMNKEIKYRMGMLVEEYCKREQLSNNKIKLYPLNMADTFNLAQDNDNKSLLITDGFVTQNKSSFLFDGDRISINNISSIFRLVQLEKAKYVIVKHYFKENLSSTDIYTDTLYKTMVDEIFSIAHNEIYEGYQMMFKREPQVYIKELEYIPCIDKIKRLERRKGE